MGRRFEVAELFELKYKDDTRWCAVIKLQIDNFFHHNGYVQTKNNEYVFNEDVCSLVTEMLTFDGVANFLEQYLKDIYMLGFDTIHTWDTPKSQSFEDVKERTVQLAYEMINAGV